MQNSSNVGYISIMVDSLQKKITILEKILVLSKSQEDILKEEKFDADKMDTIVDEKAKHITSLDELDQGFQSLYDRVKEELMINKNDYVKEIALMQGAIAKITALSTDIQSVEARNKENFQNKLAAEKRGVRTSKTANKVAANYFQNMSKTQIVGSQFLDTKN